MKNPTPCPTNIPSIMVCSDMDTIPTSVGKNKALNNGPILLVPKSILSLLKSIFLFIIFFLIVILRNSKSAEFE